MYTTMLTLHDLAVLPRAMEVMVCAEDVGGTDGEWYTLSEACKKMKAAAPATPVKGPQKEASPSDTAARLKVAQNARDHYAKELERLKTNLNANELERLKTNLIKLIQPADGDDAKKAELQKVLANAEAAIEAAEKQEYAEEQKVEELKETHRREEEEKRNAAESSKTTTTTAGKAAAPSMRFKTFAVVRAVTTTWETPTGKHCMLTLVLRGPTAVGNYWYGPALVGGVKLGFRAEDLRPCVCDNEKDYVLGVYHGSTSGRIGEMGRAVHEAGEVFGGQPLELAVIAA